jgi:RNA polymerase sigma-70 factor (ECF subfamily)
MRYRIVVQGRLSHGLAAGFDRVDVERLGGRTALVADLGDGELARLLDRLRNLGMEPVSVEAGSDRDIVDRLLSGDESTFLRLVDELTPGLRSAARMHLGDVHSVDVVLRDTWRDVLQRLEGFDCSTSLAALVFRVLLDRLGAGTTPQRPAAGSDVAAAARRAIDAMPAAQRAVIVLRDVAGRPPSEVCHTLGVPPERMRALLHEARVRVHAALDRERVLAAA